jgi:hypothetical protein
MSLRRWWWPLLALIVIASQTPTLLERLYPPRTITYDFYQDWASARNALTGVPIYADIGLTIERYLGWPLPDHWPAQYWRMNFHPPPAVLITMPFAWLDYPAAFFWWSLLSLGALVASAVMFTRQLAVTMSAAAWLIAIAVLTIWYPFREQLMQGQVNLVLLAALTGIWSADRSGRPQLAGVLLGFATAVKMFPGLLFVYFAVRHQWSVVVAGLVSFLAMTAASALLFGTDAYATYLSDVLPAATQWQSHWYNASLIALWTKLFDPGPAGGHIIPVALSPVLARVGGWASCAAVAAALVYAIARARSRAEFDLAFGTTVTAMLLMSPITWSQNLVLLGLPLALLVALPARVGPLHRAVLLLAILALFVPPHRVWGVFIDGGFPNGTVAAWQTLTVLSFQCYAVLTIFVVQLLWRVPGPERTVAAR